MADWLQADLYSAFQQHLQGLQRFLRSRLGCEVTAADLTQETFLRLSRLGQTDHIDDPRTYLFRIAANLATDYQRAQNRHTELLTQDLQGSVTTESTPTPERVALAREQIELLRRAADELPPLCRQIVYLNRFEGIPQHQIAQRLGVSKSTVERALGRAMAHFRQRLQGGEAS
jgi:RNA polymerase sigma factor (sigma-70 family)